MGRSWRTTTMAP
nr:unnamed protein product [Callosobruchus chinensis]